MKRTYWSEEFCNNLLLGSLKFSDPVKVLMPVWTSLFGTQADSRPELKERWNKLDESAWLNAEMDLEHPITAPPVKKEKRIGIYGRKDLAIALDASLQVGEKEKESRLEFAIEGEFSHGIDLPQMFGQMAGWLWHPHSSVESLYWVLIVSEQYLPKWEVEHKLTSKAAALIGPEPPSMLPIPEYIGKCTEEMLKHLEPGDWSSNISRVKALLDPKYIKSHVLLTDWSTLAKEINESQSVNPHIRLEVKQALEESCFQYRRRK